MAKRFYSEFTSEHNIDYIVEVWDADFVGTAQPFELGVGGFSLSYAGDNTERWTTILASQCEFTFYVQNGFHTSFESALIVANEGRFSVKIFREASLYWVGQVLADTFERLDMPTIHGRPLVIRATDGLGRLKDIDYNDDGTAYTGYETIIDHFFNCLNKLDILPLMSTDCVKTSVGWREDDMTTGDPLVLTRFNHKAFLKVDDKGVLTYMNCADVLKELLLKWNARITQVDGAFYIMQVGQYVDNSMTVYSYDSTGTGTGSATSQTFQQTDNASAGDMIRLSGGRFTYLAPLKYVKVDYKHFSSQNISFDRVIDTGTAYTILNVPSTGSTSTISVAFQIQNKLVFTDPNNFEYLYIKFKTTIRVGDFYYVRAARIDSKGIITYDEGGWSGSVGYYEFFSYAIEEDGQLIINDVTFITKGIPSTGDLIFGVSFDSYWTLVGQTYGLSTFTRTTEISGFYLELIFNGIIANRVQTTTYEAQNLNTNQSVGVTLESVIGDGVKDTTYGALQIYNGATWEFSDLWSGLSALEPAPILQLLTNELIAGQSKPVQKVDSTWEATGYKAHMSILYAAENYLPLRCQLSANSDIWSGEFFAVGRTIADSDPQAPLPRLIPAPGDLIRRIDISRTLPQPTPIVEPIARQIGVVYVTDSTPYIVSGGVVGSIPIIQTVFNNVFLDGDPVYLINNTTGQIQEFTVSGDVPAGAEFLNVVPETADFDIIPGSVVLPDAGFINQRINSANPATWYYQEYLGSVSNYLEWTENGGVLPTTNTKSNIRVSMGGQRLMEGINYDISGSYFVIDSNIHYNEAYYIADVFV